MKNARSTYLLIGLFAAALLSLWGLERAGVLTEAERERRRDRVLPELLDVQTSDARRVEVDRGASRLVFDRKGARNWRLTEPSDVDASPERVERLVSALKGLKKSAEAGRLEGPPESYGLVPPEVVVRLWVGDSERPVATLEIGKNTHEERYVRSGANGEVAIVDRQALAALDRPDVDWRETALVPTSALPVGGLSVRSPNFEAAAERGPNGSWRLTSPVRYPADASTVEGLLSAVASLRVDPANGGYVADHVRDFAAYGLDPPAATLELKSSTGGPGPVVLMIGASPPDHPERVYARVGGRDDVVAVDGSFRDKIPADLKALRSRFVAEIVPAAVRRIDIDAPGGPFRLVRDRLGWSLESPSTMRADRQQVEDFLKAVKGLQATEFFDPASIPDAGVDAPPKRLRIWQDAPGGGEAASEPDFSLAIGRHDALRKVIFARAGGDTAVIALPETFLESLPSSSFAFRDRDLPAVSPMGVVRLTVVRPGRTTVLEPAKGSAGPNRWRMIEPVEADADVHAVTAALARLAELRASAFVADATGDLRGFGLDKPILEVRWETEQPNGRPRATGSLRVGAVAPDDPTRHFATLVGFPAIFTIEAESLLPFANEFHETRVLKFRPEAVRRLVLRTETRTLAYKRRERPVGGPTDWTAELGTPTQGVDLSRFDNLVGGLSELRAVRFIQYGGKLPPGTGLDRPRLTIVVEPSGGPPATLRIGSRFLGDWVCAAVGDAESGPAFLLHAQAWEAMLLGAEGGLPPIPDDFFAPVPSG